MKTLSILLTSVMLTLGARSAVADPPTVNGKFFGDGDNGVYQEYSTSEGDSKLYSYLDVSTKRLYVALVNSHSVNDTVCTNQGNKDYTTSAGWNPHRDCKRLTDSEFATFTLECAPNSPTSSWSWKQAFACAQNTGTDPHSSWVSDATCPSSDPIAAWPPSVQSSSSFVANANDYQTEYPFSAPWPGGRTLPWNLYTNGVGLENWKSPFVSVTPNDVTQVPGYSTYTSYDQLNPLTSSARGWEWSMVYEWSVDLGPGGTDCGNEPIYFITGASHHSPIKTGSDENDSFPPPEDPILSDFGDHLDGNYLTTGAVGGARHYITIAGPYLGATVQPETDGQPTADATGDGDEEDGVTIDVTSNWTAGSTQTISVEVSNAPDGGALLGMWFDWNGDGDFDDPGEFFSESGLVDGVRELEITVGAGFDWESDTLNARFRIFSSHAAAPGGSLDASDFSGLALNGEVEDYQYAPNSLPVTLVSFGSRLSGKLLSAEWSTVTETFNAGFTVWGLVSGKWAELNPGIIPSQDGDVVTPHSYAVSIVIDDDIDVADIEGLSLATIDTRGRYEYYGLFEIGQEYGSRSVIEPIPWRAIRKGHDERMVTKGFVKKAGRWRREAKIGSARALQAAGSVVELEVSEAGMHRVTFEDLLAAGFDLSGVDPGAIAVTRAGLPVVRRVEAGSGNAGFGAGGFIDFWGELVHHPDALYIEKYIYRVQVDDKLARDMGESRRSARNGQDHALFSARFEEDAKYSFINALMDPWYAKALFFPNGPVEYTMSLDVADTLLADQSARLEVLVAGATDFPEVEIDHRVEVAVNGIPLGASEFGGASAQSLVFDVPAGVVKAGENVVTVSQPGVPGALFEILFVDSAKIEYTGRTTARGDRLHVDGSVAGRGMVADGFTSKALVAYARNPDGSVDELGVDARRRRGQQTWSALVSAAARPTPEVEYWISTAAALLRPRILGTVALPDLVSEPADLLLIVHPSFLPDSPEEDHPLNAYMAHRRDQGWTVRAISVDEIQNVYGGGMPLPGAVTRFLAEADNRFDFDHVLLVGGDSYDYRNRLGIDSLSFIPTLYTRVNTIPHSPSDALLTDLDGDGIGDKAVGRWPVRTLDDLSAVVAKTLDWERVDGPGSSRTSVWIADKEDPAVPSFNAQAERMIAELRTPVAGGNSEAWPEDGITRVYYDGVVAESGQSETEAITQAIIGAIDAGPALTGFVGHGSPYTWGKNIFNAKNAGTLQNEGRPTLVTTLTCYTSYFVSPGVDTLAHQLMNGSRLEESGTRTPVGAVAIHGAGTLSSYEDNERFAGQVLRYQMQEGDTLGEAIRRAREKSADDVSINWILLGDPTLRFENIP